MILEPDILEPFLPLYETNHRYYVCYGGRGGAKSFGIAQYMVLRSFDVGFKGLILRQVLSTTDESVKAQMQEVIDAMGLTHLFRVSPTKLTNLQSGNRISFMAFQTTNAAHTAKLKSITDFSHVWAEEFDEVNEAQFDKLDASVRKADVELKIILSFNTPHTRHFIFNRWFNKDGTERRDEEVCHIYTTYLNVPAKYLNDSFIRLVKKTKLEDYPKYCHVYLGHWVLEHELQIYKGWERTEYWPDDVDWVYGVDWGYSDPSAILRVGTKGEKVYIQEVYYEKYVTNADIIRVLHMEEPKTVIADSSEPKSIMELRRDGKIRCLPAIKGRDSVRHGINQVKQMKVIVVGSDDMNEDLWEEYSSYQWHSSRADMPIDKNNHLMDCLRYALGYLKRGGSKTRRYSMA